MQRGSLAGRVIKEPPSYLKAIAGNISNLIHDGDTCQMGVEERLSFVKLGLFNHKCDLGWHSEATLTVS